MTDVPPIDAIDHLAAELATEGYAIVRGALPHGDIEALDADLAAAFAETPFCVGGFYGSTTKRFGRLLNRSPRMAALAAHPLMTAIAMRVLGPWCDTIQLNVAQAIAVYPGSPAQLPHRDQDMWRAPVGEAEYLVNVIWALSPFEEANGATRVWPRSHGRQALEAEPPLPPVAAALQPGDALVFLGSTLHGAGANRTPGVRRGVVVGYSLGWLKPYENPWLAYPPSVAADFPPALAALAGYRIHRPNLGNFEGQCPSVLLADYDGRPLAAVDALRPDQQALVEAFAAERAAAP